MWIDIFAAAITAGTPLLFATLGEIYTERVGNTNLGVEGMMIMGAVVGFSTGFLTQNAALALAGAVLAGSAGALIYAVITITLRANQIVTGLALTIFGTGFASFVGLSGRSSTSTRQDGDSTSDPLERARPRLTHRV